MEIREYRDAIVAELKNMGLEVEAVDVDKANGIVLHGVSAKAPGSDVGVTMYTDGFFERKSTIMDAAKEMKRQFDEHVVNAQGFAGIGETLKDYEKVKEMLTVRLYNQSTKAEVFKSAKKYGFDDLILVPTINLGDVNGERGSIKVTRQMMEIWGVDDKTLFKDAIKNTKEDVVVKSMAQMMQEMTGFEVPDVGIMVVSNKTTVCGASAILGMLPKLKKKFDKGFFVIPSSIHEVLVVPNNDQVENSMELTKIVKEVNATALSPAEILSDKAYSFC